MKKIALLCLVLFPSFASADSLFKFKDGSAHVWGSYYNKGNQYCTMKSFGEYCVDRSDVLSIATVPPGTAASEYGVSSLGDSGVEQQREDNMKALESLNCTQLQTSTSTKAQEMYRDQCLSREQKKEWDEEQVRKEAQQREAQTEAARAKHEEDSKKRRKELEQKAVATRPRSTPD